MGVHKAYISSKIYREIKLRSGIILDSRLTILPQESVHATLKGVWNLSSDQVMKLFPIFTFFFIFQKMSV